MTPQRIKVGENEDEDKFYDEIDQAQTERFNAPDSGSGSESESPKR